MFLCDTMVKRQCLNLAISGLVLYIIYIFLSNHPTRYSSTLLITKYSTHKWSPQYAKPTSPTNITHLVFGITGSLRTWRTKKFYIESWWRPNITRGYLFLDRPPMQFLPWPSSSPPFRISEDTSRYQVYNKHKMRESIRLARVIVETFKAENQSVRWYIMSDDDTVFFVDNLLEVLGKYDHKKYFYIGMSSECVTSNILNSFEMGFGGAGYALSYPLAKALVKNLDGCIKRYQTTYGSDQIVQSCVADLGVSLTQERGFHQIDLHYDISGFLSSHPQSPLVSLHHLEAVDPIFPSMNRSESVNHLMKVAEADRSRLMQQFVCYSKQNNWTFSISWGYSAQIYEAIHPPSFLQRPLETFRPWSKWAKPPYMFNIRFPTSNPCDAPHVFFFDTLEKKDGKYIVTGYNRRGPRGLPVCSLSGNHSADHITNIQVISPMRRHNEVGGRRECCDVIRVAGMNSTLVKFRPCMKYEIV